jgi:hypothetical protein
LRFVIDPSLFPLRFAIAYSYPFINAMGSTLNALASLRIVLPLAS